MQWWWVVVEGKGKNSGHQMAILGKVVEKRASGVGGGRVASRAAMNHPVVSASEFS